MMQLWNNRTIDQDSLAKLEALAQSLLGQTNSHVLKVIEKYVNLCRPDKVTVITDAKEDKEYLRKITLERGEEMKLSTPGHTVHCDGYNDQARDRTNTRVLLEESAKLSKAINVANRERGLAEIEKLLEGIMRGKEMFICFFVLGPLNSRFSIYALQITDSAYVAHSEDILYRPGYETFKRIKDEDELFYFVHSAGQLDERGNSKDIDQRRIYIDLKENRVFSVNTQYAGNSLGLKKLALRLALKKAHQSDWIAEHMFIMGGCPEGKNRVTYFAGAFPSGCGKTSTAMVPGQTIIGDDIAYIKPGEDGKAWAVNVERGIFGIIEDVNPVDDPLIYKALTTPREVIFSNVLVKGGKPYWLGMEQNLPEEGMNYAGHWKKGLQDQNGNEILPAHHNARYTLALKELDNVDPKLHNPEGVPISGIIYGGRDPETSPPVVEAFSWTHGVFMGAALESETTAMVLGTTGQLKHDPMANVDFMVVPFGTYIENHLKFGERLDQPPKIFSTNYFLKENEKFLNQKIDKKVWLMWMEGRIHNEYNPIETPIGYLPKFGDLKDLFWQIFSRDYAKRDYEKQFAIRIPKLLARLERIAEIYKNEPDIPELFFQHLQQQKERLLSARTKHKKETVSPFDF